MHCSQGFCKFKLLLTLKLIIMKTLKLFLFVSLLLFATSAFSQGKKATYCFTIEPSWWEPSLIDCISEPVTGLLEFCSTYFDNGKLQIKVKGDLTGVSTGNIYTVSQVMNLNVQNWTWWTGYPATGTYVDNYTIEKDGIPVALMKIRQHYTLNANGELTAYVDDYSFECFPN